MKNKSIIFYIIFVMFIFGCGQKGLQHNIKIKNNTSSTIVITSCDMTTSTTTFPVEIEASKETEIITEGSNESATFYLNIDNKEFMFNTGYIQDDGYVNIEILEEDSKLKVIKNSKSEVYFEELNSL